MKNLKLEYKRYLKYNLWNEKPLSFKQFINNKLVKSILRIK